MRIRKKVSVPFYLVCVCVYRVIRVIQSGNQPCHRASSAFHAKKVKEPLRAILRGIKLLKEKYLFY